MTNNMIILNTAIQLMKDGLINPDPRGITVTVQHANGATEELPMPEELHTFQEWKRLGLIVKRGEHATARIEIWKMVRAASGEAEDAAAEADGSQEPREHFIKKLAFFFTRGQCEPATR